MRRMICSLVVIAGFAAGSTVASGARAAPLLLGYGSLPSSVTTDRSGLTYTLENGNPQNILGGLGSGLAWAGGTTFYALPDRGPNALAYNSAIDNTVSYISRFHTVSLTLTPTPGNALPFSIDSALTGTTLLYSAQPLNYGGVPQGTTASGTALPTGNWINGATGIYYFDGRSDNYGTTYGGGVAGSANQFNARLDPESIRLSNDRSTVYVSDEYGPYVYAFDAATGQRKAFYTLPGYTSFVPGSTVPAPAGNLYVPNEAPIGTNEEKGASPGNTTGRTDNKGMEGLAITPDGKTLVGILQAPTVQDAKKSGLLRIVTIDIASGATKEYGYVLTTGSGVSEIVALNSHQFLVDERDGAGVGGDPGTGIKDGYVIDLAGAVDITNLTTNAATAAAVSKTKILDIAALLTKAGIPVPSKIEGFAFGQDTLYNGTSYHTLYVANDNDFLSSGGANQFFAFGLTDADLGAAFVPQDLASSVPEPSAWGLMIAGLAFVGAVLRRRRRGSGSALQPAGGPCDALRP